MAKISAPIVDSSGDSSFDREQVVRLPAGLYGGMFAWYSLPKEYPKYQAEGTEMRFFAGFTLTHDRSNQQLPYFGEAIMGIKPKRYFNAETGMISSYVSFLYALLAGKVPMEKIVAMTDEELPDLDELIGRPVLLTVEPHAKPDKHGIYGTKVKKIDPMDAALWKAIKPLYDAKQEIANGRDQTWRLQVPKPALEEEARAHKASAMPEKPTAGELDEEVPF